MYRITRSYLEYQLVRLVHGLQSVPPDHPDLEIQAYQASHLVLDYHFHQSVRQDQVVRGHRWVQ